MPYWIPMWLLYFKLYLLKFAIYVIVLFMEFISDEQLVSDYLKGDEKSLEILIKRYVRPIYNFLVKLIGDKKEAEDLSQDIFVKVWNNLNKFDQYKKFRTWIYRIARNTSIDYLRKKKAILFTDLNDEDDSFLKNITDDEDLPDELMVKLDLKNEVVNALEKLPINYRTVIIFYYNEGLNFREISEIMGESINTVKSRHRRALELLKKIIKPVQ